MTGARTHRDSAKYNTFSSFLDLARAACAHLPRSPRAPRGARRFRCCLRWQWQVSSFFQGPARARARVFSIHMHTRVPLRLHAPAGGGVQCGTGLGMAWCAFAVFYGTSGVFWGVLGCSGVFWGVLGTQRTPPGGDVRRGAGLSVPLHAPWPFWGLPGEFRVFWGVLGCSGVFWVFWGVLGTHAASVLHTADCGLRSCGCSGCSGWVLGVLA